MCTNGYKMFLDVEEAVIKPSEGEGHRNSHREELLFKTFADKENLLRNEQKQAKNIHLEHSQLQARDSWLR